VGASGRVMGTYLHGCFSSDGFRAAMLSALGGPPQDYAYEVLIDDTLDALAAHLEANMNVAKLLALATPVKNV
jgi:adenosylcobyric acid synthase